MLVLEDKTLHKEARRGGAEVTLIQYGVIVVSAGVVALLAIKWKFCSAPGIYKTAFLFRENS